MKSIPIIHIHIPKAAGSTITSAFLQAFPKEEVFLCGDNEFGLDHLQSNAYFIKLKDEEKLKYKFIAGHVEWPLAQSYPGEYYSFAFLRNPISRISSMYFFIKQNTRHNLHRKIIEHNISLEDFSRANLWHDIDNGMCRRISGVMGSVPYGCCNDEILNYAKYNLGNNISFFGLQEKFDESLFLMMHELDALDLLDYSKKNVTGAKKSDKELTPSERASIEEFNKYDLQLYSFARELYAFRNKQKMIALEKPISIYINAMKEKHSLSRQ